MVKVFDRLRSRELKARIADLRYTLYLLRRNPLVVVGSIISIFFIIIALTANLIVNPLSATQYNYARMYEWNNPYFSWGSGSFHYTSTPPIYYLGTDGYGRDLLQMIILAIPLDIALALFITLGAIVIGVSLGALAGYVGGVIDEVILRITDIFFAFPWLLLAIVFAAIFGRTIENLAIAVLLVWWPTYVRLVRGQVLSEKEKTYVEALRALGAGRPRTQDMIRAQTDDLFDRFVTFGRHNSIIVELTRLLDRVERAAIDRIATLRGHFRILFRHILPNSIYPILVQATLDLGGVILTFSALMFLGFSPSPALPELGNLASDGINHVFEAPWLILFPGFTILLIALAFNLVGDGLRDVLDPRLRR
jgi:peptide/nickel transport system permease protein